MAMTSKMRTAWEKSEAAVAAAYEQQAAAGDMVRTASKRRTAAVAALRKLERETSGDLGDYARRLVAAQTAVAKAEGEREAAQRINDAAADAFRQASEAQARLRVTTLERWQDGRLAPAMLAESEQTIDNLNKQVRDAQPVRQERRNAARLIARRLERDGVPLGLDSYAQREYDALMGLLKEEGRA